LRRGYGGGESFRNCGRTASIRWQSVAKYPNLGLLVDRDFEHLIDQVAVADFVERQFEKLELKIEVHAFRTAETYKPRVKGHI
jgi:hypothetical protein